MTDVKFEQGGYYRGHIAIDAFGLEPSADKVRDTLLEKTANRFSDLKVYKYEAPETWPPDEREDKSPLGFASYWLEGKWTGTSGSIPQSTSVYQILWVRRTDIELPKDEYEPKASVYEWIPIAGTLLLMGVALYTAVKGASK